MSKELFIRKILKRYELIVDFDGKPDLKNVPSPLKDGETFKNWSARVLKGCTNVRVFMPLTPAPQRKIHSLQKAAKTQQLEQVFRAVIRLQELKASEAVAAAAEDAQLKIASAENDAQRKVVATADRLRSRYATIFKDTIDDIQEQLADELEPSVTEFLGRLSDSAGKDRIAIETAMFELIKAYNQAVKRAH